MSTPKRLASSAAVLLLFAGPAAAVTVKNTSGTGVGINYGTRSIVDKVPAGKSVTFECNDGCGVTGPWGFSWMAKGTDTFTTNGKSMITARG